MPVINQHRVRSLVVTTDGSPRSFRVLGHAQQLAAAAKLDLHMLHVFDDSAEQASLPAYMVADQVARRRKEVESKIRVELRKRRLHAGLTVIMKPVHRRLAETILDGAVSLGAVALAMDSRGENLARTTVLGSTALRVLAGSHLPVMVSADSTREVDKGRSQRILTCADGSAAAESIARSMTAMLLDARLAISVLAIEEQSLLPPRRTLELATRIARWFPPHIEVQRAIQRAPGRGDIASEIVAAAAANGASAIALTTRGFRLAHRLFPGSIGLAVLAKSPVPVILGR